MRASAGAVDLLPLGEQRAVVVGGLASTLWPVSAGNGEMRAMSMSVRAVRRKLSFSTRSRPSLEAM
jgi:3-oxoacyl-(acyl-carrier-protein) synthase